MKRMYRILIIGFALTFLSIVLTFDNVWTQIKVSLITRPANVQNILIRPNPKPIAIIAQTPSEKQNLQYEWTMPEGQGELKGTETKGSIIIYLPPSSIDVGSAQVTISVKVSDDTETIANENITFQLFAPTPTPIPTPIPTPTPVPTPIPQLKIIDVLVKSKENKIFLDPIYELAPGTSVIIIANITGPSDHEITVEYSGVFGTLEPHESGGRIYTVPNTPGGQDIITVNVIDKTAKEVRSKAIIISISEI